MKRSWSEIASHLKDWKVSGSRSMFIWNFNIALNSLKRRLMFTNWKIHMNTNLYKEKMTIVNHLKTILLLMKSTFTYTPKNFRMSRAQYLIASQELLSISQCWSIYVLWMVSKQKFIFMTISWISNSIVRYIILIIRSLHDNTWFTFVNISLILYLPILVVFYSDKFSNYNFSTIVLTDKYLFGLRKNNYQKE